MRRTLTTFACAGALALPFGVVPLASASPASAAAVAPAAVTAAPAALPTASTPDVRAVVRRMSTDEKIGQLFVQPVYGGSADARDRRNVARYGVARPSDVVAKYRLGGVVYFGWTGSFGTPAATAGLSNGLQRRALTSGAKVPLQIATDQEQGSVVRLGGSATQLPGAMALGAGGRAVDARTAAAITGAELRAVGVNTNYAPDADVNANAANPVIGVRSFSSSPTLAAAMVAAQVAGFGTDANVAATAKHFPGHGDTGVDSHTGLPVIEHDTATWERLDAPPFRAAVKAGVDQVMTGHLVVPALDRSGEPATLSKPIVSGVLRGKLGFRGVIVSDSLEMRGVRTRHSDGEVAVRAVLAGVDQLLMAPKMDEAYGAVRAAVASGRISRARLDESVTRILALKAKRGLFVRPYADVARAGKVVGAPVHRRRADAIADRGVTVLRRDTKAMPFAPRGRRVTVVGAGPGAIGGVADELSRRGAVPTRVVTGDSPTSKAIASAVTAARRADRVVVTTSNASRTSGRAQRDLVAALLRTGKPVVVVAVADPYDVAALAGVRSYVAVYGATAVSGRAAARVLVGASRGTGRLPVAVPGARGVTLFPVGAGVG